MCNLINESIDSSDFPDSLKLAEVSSQFKKGDSLNKMNYRPVSVLAAMSKIYGRVMAKQLSSYFMNIFSTLLSAFRQKYSCQSSLLNMIHCFKNALDNGEFVGCISMDLSKAFDCLPHSLIICKLYAYGVSASACKLIASYLYKRKQRVKIENEHSEWLDISKGVPQGSILGHLIFNIFINDIFYFIHDGNLYNYADDNWVTVHHKELTTLQGILQNEAKLMVEWFEINAMQANPDKFQGMLLKGAKTVGDFAITVEGTEIAFVSEINALGVCIDDQLSFNAHVDRICTKAGRQVSALQRLTGVLDCESRLAIYKSFIMSNFDYCPIVWFFTSRASITKMEKIQERALRFVLKDSRSSYEEMLGNLKVDSIRMNGLKKLSIEIYKLLNGLSPDYLSVMFEKSKNPYGVRDINKLIQPIKKSTNNGLKSFQYFGAHVWNILPTDIKNSLSICEFKTVARTVVQLHGLYPDYITYSVIYMGYEKVSHIALCINRIKPLLSYAQNA